ncbi:deoxyuridine 5'-triphosphate nucleotidohydrolase [Azorhizobium oxalatiphilum]|uniref:Deoxyuridine 5'-triphosphate nucleotidohydrolase n=1 Tax=Azorhizobium oxalatiphilum TaxID=980631 RepID=A0A917F5B9_9HYPH|nr:dUTP diphosphatase [Azorhizobium oxalatiphilum]GGF48183.1 deoxyuridine 5'-triphosphate nucleotidohydrolase [Azorhizobium oxalatiphilum]
MSNSRLNVAVVRLPHAEGLPLPDYATALSAGMDLIAAVPDGEPLVLQPGDFQLVPTGLSIELPDGYEAQVRPRSGLAFKHGVTVLNAPGTIDADYRGEVKALLINQGREPFEITRGLRIAQMVVAPIVQIKLVESGELGKTARGVGGFGSTGLDGTPQSR